MKKSPSPSGPRVAPKPSPSKSKPDPKSTSSHPALGASKEAKTGKRSYHTTETSHQIAVAGAIADDTTAATLLRRTVRGSAPYVKPSVDDDK